MNIEITRMSSKGQVVIPIEMRKNFKEGDKLLVIEGKGQIILKKASKADRNFKEDLEFARRTEEAWKEIDSGKGIKTSAKDFLKEIKSW